jgi:hypothetical protein
VTGGTKVIKHNLKERSPDSLKWSDRSIDLLLIKTVYQDASENSLIVFVQTGLPKQSKSQVWRSKSEYEYSKLLPLSRPVPFGLNWHSILSIILHVKFQIWITISDQGSQKIPIT